MPASERASTDGTHATTTLPVTDITELGSWGMEMAAPELTDRKVSLAGDLAAFGRPRRAADDFEHEAVDFADDSAEGDELPGSSRLLLGHLGMHDLALYGVPTRRGWVCIYLVYEDFEEYGGGTCANGLVGGFGLKLEGDGTYYQLYGVVADDIRDASLLVTDGRDHPVRVGGNGFYFEARTTSVCPVDIEYLLGEYKSGKTFEIAFAKLAPPLASTRRETFGCRV
jgi:hypothetical protein